jgi:hypothetical protein
MAERELAAIDGDELWEFLVLLLHASVPGVEGTPGEPKQELSSFYEL